MLSAVVLALGIWGGQLVDGHVHKAPHGGVLAHCGPYLVEVVVRRAPDVADRLPVAALVGQAKAVVPDAQVEAWLLSEKDTAVTPGARKLKVRSAGREAALPVRGDGFAGTLAVGDREVPLEIELVEGNRTARTHLVWSNLDDRERLDDAPGRRRQPLERPRTLNPTLPPRSR
jgi:hypothetical protein